MLYQISDLVYFIFLFTFACQLKKISYILFSFFYLTLASHLSASIHFCGGKITSISFFEHNDEDACECGKMTDNSCCNDLNFQLKTNENSTNIVNQINFNFTQKFTSIIFEFYDKIIGYNQIYKSANFYIFDHKPPFVLLQLSAIFLRI